MPSLWGLCLQHMNLEKTQTFGSLYRTPGTVLAALHLTQLQQEWAGLLPSLIHFLSLTLSLKSSAIRSLYNLSLLSSQKTICCHGQLSVSNVSHYLIKRKNESSQLVANKTGLGHCSNVVVKSKVSIYIYFLRDDLLDLASSHSNQLKANKPW